MYAHTSPTPHSLTWTEWLPTFPSEWRIPHGCRAHPQHVLHGGRNVTIPHITVRSNWQSIQPRPCRNISNTLQTLTALNRQAIPELYLSCSRNLCEHKVRESLKNSRHHSVCQQAWLQWQWMCVELYPGARIVCAAIHSCLRV
jgi:hypothetical protein